MTRSSPNGPWVMVACAIAVLILMVTPALRPPGIRLRDGTVLRLLAATTGPQHQFTAGQRYEGVPYRWLPGSLRDRLGWRHTASALQVTDAASLMVWYALHVPGSTNTPSRLFRSVDLVGPTGDRIAAGAQSRTLLADGSGAGLVLFPGLATVPNGARLRFRYGTGTGWVTEADVPDPRRLR